MSTDTTLTTVNVDLDEIPGYRIERLIARGGMGAVYLAQDTTLRRAVAIKVINREFSADPEYQRRFSAEATTVAGFQHPNIITVYASGWVEGKQFIAMEHVSGGTLDTWTAANGPDLAAITKLAAQMASALAYAHARDVVHRDFKPRNVLMREGGSPVLSDFGVAKTENLQAAATVTGMVVGNLRYMAPEQARGDKVTDRVDVYSFGLVVYEMLVGALPPVGSDGGREKLSEAVESDLADLIGRCLANEPSMRPSAQECHDWLESRTAAAALSRGFKYAAATVAIVLAGIVAAFVAFRGGMVGRSPWPSASANTIQLTIQRLPEDAKVFLDDTPVTGDLIELTVGSHRVAAVAPQYYGQIQDLSVSADERPAPVSFELRPTRLPSYQEQELFVKLTESPALTAEDVALISESTLNTVLQAQLLRQSGKSAQFSALWQATEALRRAGDARAAVTSILIDSEQSGQVTQSQLTPSLMAASDSGDAMASLVIAMAYRGSMQTPEARISPDDVRFQRYCKGMELAVKQGWAEVAGEYRRRDGCGS